MSMCGNIENIFFSAGSNLTTRQSNNYFDQWDSTHYVQPPFIVIMRGVLSEIESSSGPIARNGEARRPFSYNTHRSRLSATAIIVSSAHRYCTSHGLRYFVFIYVVYYVCQCVGKSYLREGPFSFKLGYNIKVLLFYTYENVKGKNLSEAKTFVRTERNHGIRPRGQKRLEDVRRKATLGAAILGAGFDRSRHRTSTNKKLCQSSLVLLCYL